MNHAEDQRNRRLDTLSPGNVNALYPSAASIGLRGPLAVGGALDLRGVFGLPPANIGLRGRLTAAGSRLEASERMYARLAAQPEPLKQFEAFSQGLPKGTADEVMGAGGGLAAAINNLLLRVGSGIGRPMSVGEAYTTMQTAAERGLRDYVRTPAGRGLYDIGDILSPISVGSRLKAIPGVGPVIASPLDGAVGGFISAAAGASDGRRLQAGLRGGATGFLSGTATAYEKSALGRVMERQAPRVAEAWKRFQERAPVSADTFSEIGGRVYDKFHGDIVDDLATSAVEALRGKSRPRGRLNPASEASLNELFSPTPTSRALGLRGSQPLPRD